jgi:hypothetical protein
MARSALASAAGDVIYRGTDAQLAHEIHHALPGADLLLLTDHTRLTSRTCLATAPLVRKACGESSGAASDVG